MSKTVETKLVDISPHRSILMKISQTGYSIQEAISELIDNAIDARIEGQKCVVRVDITPDQIVVSDNGIGMNEEQVINSVRLGFSSKKGKLGEFGLGLKTSTAFLGRNFTLTTKMKQSHDEFILKYDEQDWLKNGDWNKFPLFVRRDIDSDKSGTIIAISNLKVTFSDKLLKNIRDEFGVRFGPFIQNGELDLIFNNEHCNSIHQIIIDNTKNKLHFSLGTITVDGWWGYQLSGLNKSSFGFHSYRRGRLVTIYDKIGLTPNQDIRQIVGELHIEGIPITHDKKSWLKSSVEYQSLESYLREFFKPFEKNPKRVLSGFPASSGKVVGTVRRLNMFMSGNMEQEIQKVGRGDIIVTEMTRPQYLLAIRRSGGVITDLGGNLCHAAIASREFAIPAVVGTQTATSVLRDGQRVILDGNEGNVYTYED